MANTAQVPVWKIRLFVVGHVAKGLVYCIIGGLGTYAVIRGLRDPQGMGDVLVWLQEQVFGKVLVTLLGIGLLGHGVWRWVKTFDSHTKAHAKLVAIAMRVAHAFGGTFYCLLSVFAFSLLWSAPDTTTDDGTRKEVLQFTLEIPWGEWVVGLVGAIIILVGIIIAVGGMREQMILQLNKDHLTKWELKVYRAIGMVGHLALGLVNGIIGYFLIRVAMTSEPEEYRGIKGALQFLGGRTFGPLLLAAVSVGLLLFGLFMFAKARYHRAE